MSRYLILHSEQDRVKAEKIAGILRGTGLSARLAKSLDEQDEAPELTIVLGSEERMSEWNVVANRRGLSWLPVRFNRLGGSLGPLVVPGVTACHECLKQRMVSLSSPSVLEAESGFELSWQIFAGIAALEVVKWSSRHKSSFAPLTLGHLLEFDAFHIEGELSAVHRVPTCPVCGVRRVAGLAAQPWREASLAVQV
ncbi:TOMM precursor leader peptide-binding protein [Saccharibacillus kuerlensis]|uniref:Bacteriocin biosynthesis cyclodehydratase domain-containing protein n=1 Tax=Saccharibacillus kuerlensis TaxID=459527 RepID=A0ABQ2L1X8_9BACL|nr:TOMM precursor leader peptide-binding protein [Saccharibacillus kuerlensis]GGN99994.1 hypothetical protein GCM10010969_20700 [Saccharibacillus kuerlensis]